MHPVYTQITTLFEPYKSSIYFLFQRLCGKFSERTNILKRECSGQEGGFWNQTPWGQI